MTPTLVMDHRIWRRRILTHPCPTCRAGTDERCDINPRVLPWPREFHLTRIAKA